MSFFCAGASQGAENAAPLKLRFGGDSSQTRVVLELDKAVSAEVAAGGEPADQVVLNFSRLSVGGELDGQGKGLVKTWTLERAGGKARLSLDLKGRGKVRRRFLLPPGEGVSVYRYVLDIEAAGPAPQVMQAAAPAGKAVRAKGAPAAEAEAEAAGLQKTALAEPPSAKAKIRVGGKSSAKDLSPAPRAKKIVVIDAGHGGHDPGALGSKSHEKDVTLAAAKALRDRLERTGRFTVVMTRDSDVYIPLENRVKIARGALADLFISLHADSGGDPKVRGATVYTLSDHGEDRATRNVFNGGFMDVHLPGRDLSVKQILLDLTQRTTRNRSGAFAETLLEHISSKTPLLRRSHRDAGYMVLLAPDVPAVLLEMGFITNPEDEASLNDRRRREALMDAVGDAIEAYFTQPVQVAQD